MTDIAVHPEFAASGSFGHLRLGRVEPDETPKLELEPFLPATFEPPPVSVDHFSAIPSFPMYGNDNLGDCTWAAIGHAVQVFTVLAGAERTPADADIEQGYWETGTPPSATGQPGDPTDDGRMEPKVLSYWRHNGIPNEQDSIIGYAAVNHANDDRVKFTIANFGCAYVAMAMPLTAEQQQIWDYVADDPNNQPYSWGGHAVVIVGYDADYLYVVTWGFVLKMTWAFWQHYGVACYALISPDMVGRAQAAGVNTEGIVSQIGVLTSEAAGGDLAADAVVPTPTPDPEPQPASAPETQAYDVSVAPDVVHAESEDHARADFIAALVEDGSLVTVKPHVEAPE